MICFIKKYCTTIDKKDTNSGIIEDITNGIALNIVGSNTSNIRIIIGGTVYNESGFLEVELSTLAVSLDDEYVLLTRETASEDNNLGFEVQRSNDMENWEVVDFIEGQGTTTATTNYEFRDHYPKGGNNYYRLTIIKFDEDFNYRSLVVISLKNKSGAIVSISPNPAQNYINLSNDALESDLNPLRILNIEDKPVLETNWEQLETLDISQLPAGLYIVENNCNKKKTVRKLLIQR